MLDVSFGPFALQGQARALKKYFDALPSHCIMACARMTAKSNQILFPEIDALVRELANILWQMNEICSMYLSNSETESQKEEEQECV